MPTTTKKKPRRYDPLYYRDIPDLLQRLRDAVSADLGVPVSKASAIMIALREALAKRAESSHTGGNSASGTTTTEPSAGGVSR